jgi:hypothetical protein
MVDLGYGTLRLLLKFIFLYEFIGKYLFRKFQ